jgi:hypothetical protein
MLLRLRVAVAALTVGIAGVTLAVPASADPPLPQRQC